MTKQQLKERCEAEFENITATLSELDAIFDPESESYTTADLAAMATFIHNFYNGLENILKRILISRQKAVKETATWHKDLLKISLNAEIITPELFEKLSDYLSFRHFFIHGYGFTLKWEAIKPLVSNVNKIFDDFKSAVGKEII